MLSSSHRCSCGIETCEIILCRPRCLQAACRALCSWHTVMELVWLRLLWFRFCGSGMGVHRTQVPEAYLREFVEARLVYTCQLVAGFVCYAKQ